MLYIYGLSCETSKTIFIKNKNGKKQSWKVAAKDFGITVDDAYKKFRSLWTHAKCETKKFQKKRESAGGTSSMWLALSAISFVLSRNLPEAGFYTVHTVGEVT